MVQTSYLNQCSLTKPSSKTLTSWNFSLSEFNTLSFLHLLVDEDVNSWEMQNIGQTKTREKMIWPEISTPRPPKS